MATQEEAYQAIIDAIAETAPQVPNAAGLRDLAEAYSLIAKPAPAPAPRQLR